jgi:hypothetical protein
MHGDASLKQLVIRGVHVVSSVVNAYDCFDEAQGACECVKITRHRCYAVTYTLVGAR